MKTILKYIILISSLVICIKGWSQEYTLLNSFNTNQGLPSNHIYSITQDTKGFLWMATDNGVSRFDGNNFKNFTTQDGLPSNDVIQIGATNDGRVWVNCFKETPAYFDANTNKFITFKQTKSINTLKGEVFFMSLINKDTIEYTSNKSQIFFANGKLLEDPNIKGSQNKTRCYIHPKIQYFFSNYSNDKLLNIILSNQQTISLIAPISKYQEYKNYIYIFSKNAIYRFSVSNKMPVTSTLDTLQLSESISTYKFCNNQLLLVNEKGAINSVNLNTFNKLDLITCVDNSKSVFIDKDNNYWIGTEDNGLFYMAKSDIETSIFPNAVNTKNIISLAYDSVKNILIAGNKYGQLFEGNLSTLQEKTYNISIENNDKWVREVIKLNNNIVAANYGFLTLNYTNKVTIPFSQFANVGIKSIAALSDTILILGTVSGIMKYNLISKKSELLENVGERIFQIAKKNEFEYYYLTAKKLFKHKLLNNETYYLQISKDPNETPLLIYSIPNKDLWVYTNLGNLVCIKNDEIVNKINKNQGMPNDVSNFLVVHNTIWLASKSGVCKINIIDKKIQNFTKVDGLSSNNVNDLLVVNKHLIVATENGLSKIPLNFSLPNFNISPQLVSAKVNQISLPIKASYQLKQNQTNIALAFAGVDVSGHFKSFQYALNDNINWLDLDGNSLNIQLPFGISNLYIRCIDANNNISPNKLYIEFNIDTPFYKTFLFWIFLTGLATALIFYWYNQKKLDRQKNEFLKQQALADQQKKITADLHDDIGATLSSLQINSTIAKRMMTKNPDRAAEVIDTIEEQAKELSEKVGDIIWSLKGKDAFGTFSDRIKTYINQILDHSTIDYKINIDPKVDEFITDSNVKKNLLLISKEAINNAVKYSKAKLISINCIKQDNEIQLSIIDNGIGFENDIQNGNGLKNIKQRVEEINGKVLFDSKPGQGVRVNISVPLIKC